MHSAKAVLKLAFFKGGNARIHRFPGTDGPVQGRCPKRRQDRPPFLSAQFPKAKSSRINGYILPNRSNITTMLRLIENSVSSP